jgi:hypothetical protein
MANAGMMGGLGSLADGFLQGRQARIAQQQQDLEQQKYQFTKEHQAVLDAQKDYELRTGRTAAADTAGDYFYNKVMGEAPPSADRQALMQRQAQFQDQGQPQEASPPQVSQSPLSSNEPATPEGVPSSSDWAEYMGTGALNKEPGKGIIAQQAPQQQPSYATVPATNNNVNDQMSQLNAMPKPVRMMMLQNKFEATKEARSKVNEVLGHNGKAHVGYATDGTPIPVVDQEDPKTRAETTNAQETQYNKYRDEYNHNEVKQNTDFAAEAFNKATKLYKDPSKKGQQMFVLNLVKLDMGKQAAREGTLDKMEENPQIMSKWGDEINKARSGLLTPETMQDMYRTAANLYQGTRATLDDAQNSIRQDASGHGVKADFLNNSAYASADKAAKEALKTTPTFAENQDKNSGFFSGVGGLLSKAFGGQQKQSTAGPSGPHGQTVRQNGHTYTWNPSSGKYE